MMKRLLIITVLALLLASCTKYYKVDSIGHDVIDNKITYQISIYENGFISRDLKCYLRASTTGDPCKMSDSLNAVADTIIAKFIRLDNCE